AHRVRPARALRRHDRRAEEAGGPRQGGRGTDRRHRRGDRMTTLRQATAVAGTRILGIGSSQPERVVTNDDLAKIMDTNDQWIRDRVGIAERRFGGPEDTVVSMAVDAGSKA